VHLQPADWTGLLQQALKQGVGPLLYRRVSANDADAAIPPDFVEELRGVYMVSALRNMRLYHQLRKLLLLLQTGGIPAIVLKGAHLAEFIYRDVAVRPMQDIDIMVREEDLRATGSLLQEAGYATPPEAYPFSSDYYHLPILVHPQFPAPVEVHRSIGDDTGPHPIDTDGLWARARPAKVIGMATLVLSPEDLLLHMSLHASVQHKFEVGLIHLCDIAEITRRYGAEMDWDQVGRRSCAWGAARGVYLTLRFAKNFLGAVVPDGALETMKPAGFKPELLDWACERILYRDTLKCDALIPPGLARWCTLSHLGDRVALLLRVLLPSRHVMAEKYRVAADSPRLYARYPANLASLFLRNARPVWKLLRCDGEMPERLDLTNRQEFLTNWLAAP